MQDQIQKDEIAFLELNSVSAVVGMKMKKKKCRFPEFQLNVLCPRCPGRRCFKVWGRIETIDDSKVGRHMGDR